MALNDGQIIGGLTAVLTAIVGAGGWIANRYGTFTNRQTEIEKNLLEQIKTNSARLDAGERERTAMESAFRTQLEEAAKERRAIEREFRATMNEMEKEITELQAANIELKHENWLLKNGIGSREVIPKQKRQSDDEAESTGEV